MNGVQLRGRYTSWSVRRKPPVFSLQEVSMLLSFGPRRTGGTCSERCQNILDSQQCLSFVYFAKNVSCFGERVVTSRVLQVKVWPAEETRQRADDTWGLIATRAS